MRSPARWRWRETDQSEAGDAGAAGQTPVRAGNSAGARSALASALLGGAGLVAIVAALLVRVHWHNAAMTVLAVILALALGISGLAYLMFALWILLTSGAPPTGPAPPSVRPGRGSGRPSGRSRHEGTRTGGRWRHEPSPGVAG